LVRRETQQNQSRRLKLIFGEKPKGVLTIETPSADGVLVMETDKDKIEQGCIDENIRRFTQANQTPSLQSDQVELLGRTDTKKISKNILEGLIGTRLHVYIQNLAKNLSTPDTIKLHKPIETVVSIDDYTLAWRHCREFTSSGISSLHFGHFKASSLHHATLEVDRMMAAISLKSGYSISRWHTVIDVMIPKK
jgi:hypothetical protein